MWAFRFELRFEEWFTFGWFGARPGLEGFGKYVFANAFREAVVCRLPLKLPSYLTLLGHEQGKQS